MKFVKLNAIIIIFLAEICDVKGIMSEDLDNLISSTILENTCTYDN